MVGGQPLDYLEVYFAMELTELRTTKSNTR